MPCQSGPPGPGRFFALFPSIPLTCVHPPAGPRRATSAHGHVADNRLTGACGAGGIRASPDPSP